MRVLIIEDDVVLRSGLRDLMNRAGYEADAAGDIRAAWAAGAGGPGYGAYLADVMLPDGSGVDFCAELRAKTAAPILLLTALDDEESVIAGLSAGADDYISKPFRARELLARLAANLRRSAPRASLIESGALVCRGADRFFLNGEPLTLPPNGRKLLSALLESAGRLLTREHLFYRLWDIDENYVDENTLSVEVSRLRKALGRFRGADYIETVRGVGYRWALPIMTVGKDGDPDEA
ncbi:MAG: response regulator transcription factor [Clostridia bacterium]|nr:response regulator transcription factor [Clostridia bacterium]